MQFKGDAVARVKHNFSRQHLVAARHFADLADKVESRPCLSEEEKSQHRAYATGAVVFSVAFLEASINELYLEAIDGNQQSLKNLTDQQMATLANFWDIVERAPVLKKYQVALTGCWCPPFDKGASQFQDIDSLIDIRNALDLPPFSVPGVMRVSVA